VGRLFFLALIGGAGATSLLRPWVGVVTAYLFVVLVPQQVWWWNFDNLRPVRWILLPTILGFMLAFVRNELDLSTIRNRRTLYMLTLWAFYFISYLAGPYVGVNGPYRYTQPSWAMSNIQNFMVLYFLAAVCIDSLTKLKALVYVFTASGIYLIYWINAQYFSGQAFGRIPGPVAPDGSGIYADHNNFAMLFVVVIPFLWYLGQSTKHWIRYALWLVIPFAWHGVFLTGSRGGLVGIAVTMAVIIWRSKNKAFGILLVPAFVAAYVLEAGDVMRERAATISEYETESSAHARFESWDAAIKMIKANPLIGVGMASFAPAFPDYSSNEPREAHNTFLHITAESGVIAGSMYLLIVFSVITTLWKVGKRTRNSEDEDSTIYFLNEAVLVGFTGLIVCSLFLSLQLFEIFYCLCVMANGVIFVADQKETAVATEGIARAV